MKKLSILAATAAAFVMVGSSPALAQQSGQQLWEAQLRANANANPMTYRGRSGKQYVAINAGGTIVSYSLTR